MYIFTKSTLVIVLFSLILTGCDEVDSEELKTSEIYIYSQAKSFNESQIEVRVEMRKGKNLRSDFVDLSGADNLVAKIDDSTRILRKEENLAGEIGYESTFKYLDSSSLKKVEVVFIREDSSYTNTMTMTQGFVQQSPSTGHEFSFSLDDDITFTWLPISGEWMSLSMDVECAYSSDVFVIRYTNADAYDGHVYKAFSDNGILTIPVSLILEKLKYRTTDGRILYLGDSGYVAPDLSRLNCIVDTLFERNKVSFSVHSAFRGGELRTIQKRTSWFFLRP